MTTPTIPDLPVATVANNSDEMLVRQPAGALGTDKRVTIDKIRNLDINALGTLPTGTPIASDQMIIERSGTNYAITFEDVGFIQGTKMWFYHNAASQVPGWAIVASSDNLLAVKGGATYTTGGVQQGTWQQEDHTLTTSQIPSHSHRMTMAKDTTGSTSNMVGAARGKTAETDGNIQTYTQGGGLGHNHGSSWRPLASVGIICVKS